MVTSRIWFTAAQKAELWERWKNGQSAAAISRALERKNKTGVERIVVLHGGIVPSRRWRALAALRFDEREEIMERGKLSRSFAGVVLPDLRLVVQDHVQQRVTDFQFSVVFDIAQFAKFIHEKTHA